jgi:hypothetical protein
MYIVRIAGHVDAWRKPLFVYTKRPLCVGLHSATTVHRSSEESRIYRTNVQQLAKMPNTVALTVAQVAPRRRITILHKLFHIGPDPALVARVNALRVTLAEVKADIEIRKFFVDLMYARGRHCLVCSPLRCIGACGSACALLRPADGGGVFSGITEAMTDSWMAETVSIGRCYDKVAPEILAARYSIGVPTLQRLEEAVERMRDRLV